MSGYLYRGSPALEAINAQIMAWRQEGGGKVSTQRPLPPCGTYARYRRHQKAHEPVDLACELAAAQLRHMWKEHARLGGKATAKRWRDRTIFNEPLEG